MPSHAPHGSFHLTIARTWPLLLCSLTATVSAADPYTISTTPPRLLFNNADVRTDLQQQLASNLTPATRFRDYVLNEMASPGRNYAFEAHFAALMYQVTGTVSYAQFAHDKVMHDLAAEEARIASGHAAEIAHDSYLYIGDILGDMMRTLDWCPTYFTTSERTRLYAYANQALANLWNNPANATWGGASFPWSGWATNDPANNYYYSFLTATMMTGVVTHGDNPQAQVWIDKFRAKLDQLSTYFAANLARGGSAEQTGYGTAMRNLFRLYYYWEKSTGENIADRTTHALNSSYWLLHATTPDYQYLAPLGDHARDSTAEFFDYHRNYLLALHKLHPSDPGARAAKTMMALGGHSQIGYAPERWADYLYNQTSVSGLPLNTLSTAYYNADVGNFATRSDWTTSATYISQIAGPYTQSHAHRDQGSFLLWKGEWLFDDENLRSHSGIEQDELNHNLVRFVGPGGVITQVVGTAAQVRALADNAAFSYTSCDTKAVYNGKPQVVTSQRELLFIKPNCLVVFDRASANAASVSRVFSLNMSTAPTIAGDKLSLVKGANRADCWRLAPTSLPWTITAYTDAVAFPGGGVRAEATHATGTDSRFLHVIGVNNDITAVAASNTGAATGASITFADGRTAIVRFANSATGGTLDLRATGGAVVFNAALPSTVVVPPLLVVADTTAPALTAIAAGLLTSSGATITWTTDEVANGQVEYGTTTAYGSSSSLVTALTIGHGIALTGLTPNTTYHYRVKSSDGSANQAVSSDRTFTTAALNTAPVLSAITATPTAVTGTSTALSATASDNAGEPALTYTWSATPATVTFSPNGSNAAKAATATFSAAGSYTLTCTVRDAGSLTTTGTVAVTVAQTPTTVAITPALASVAAGGTVTFAAAVQDQFATAIAAPTVAWAITAGTGTITSAGVYTAPAAGGAATVRAMSGSASSTAAVSTDANGSGAGPGTGSNPGCSSGLAGVLLAGLSLLAMRRTRGLRPR